MLHNKKVEHITRNGITVTHEKKDKLLTDEFAALFYRYLENEIKTYNHVGRIIYLLEKKENIKTNTVEGSLRKFSRENNMTFEELRDLVICKYKNDEMMTLAKLISPLKEYSQYGPFPRVRKVLENI